VVGGWWLEVMIYGCCCLKAAGRSSEVEKGIGKVESDQYLSEPWAAAAVSNRSNNAYLIPPRSLQ
jgi:hypothetical protein